MNIPRVVVRPIPEGFLWSTNLPAWVGHVTGRPLASVGEYASADHALRDAWTWWPELPALIYTRRP